MFTLGDIKFQVVTTPELREAMYRLNRSLPRPVPGFLDNSQEDDHALLFGALDPQGNLLGGAKLILRTPEGVDASGKAAEILPLVLHPTLAGNIVDDIGDIDQFLDKVPDGPVNPMVGAAWENWRKRMTVGAGLIRILFEAGRALAINEYFLRGEPEVSAILRRHGINFTPVGAGAANGGEICKGADWEILPGVLALLKKVADALGLDQFKAPSTVDDRLVRVDEFGFGGFYFQVARNKADLEGAYALRELLERVAAGPASTVPLPYAQKLGRDRYDNQAVHLVAKKKGQVVGTVRLVLNFPERLPCLEFAYPNYPEKTSSSKRMAEISRLAFSINYAEAVTDILKMARVVSRRFPEPKQDKNARRLRWQTALIFMGLVRLGYRVSKHLRVTRIYLTMEEPLAALFARRGFFSHKVGGVFHGKMFPYIMNFQEIETALLDFRAVRAVLHDMVAWSTRRQEFDPIGLGDAKPDFGTEA